VYPKPTWRLRPVGYDRDGAGGCWVFVPVALLMLLVMLALVFHR
jgi:hypothetical protein